MYQYWCINIGVMTSRDYCDITVTGALAADDVRQGRAGDDPGYFHRHVSHRQQQVEHRETDAVRLEVSEHPVFSY